MKYVEAVAAMREAGNAKEFDRALTDRVSTQAKAKLGVAAFVLIVGVVSVVATESLGLYGQVGEMLMLVGVIGVVAGLPMIIGFGIEYERSRQGARVPVLVAMGRCGACGYDLLGSEAEGDECIVCPECGAAWRVSSASDV